MFKKIVFSVFAIAASVIAGLGIMNQPVSADEICSNDKQFGIRLWCAGVESNPSWVDDDDGSAMKAYIINIVSNVIQMILDIAAYVAVIIVMYGGFLYMTSQDNPGTIAKAKKIITNSVIGMVIVKSGSIFVGLAQYLAGLIPKNATSAGEIAINIANEIFFWAGIVVVIMIAWGGLNYVTSSGDPGKMTKAKQTIVSSLIGLAIIILAAVIVNMVVDTFVLKEVK